MKFPFSLRIYQYDYMLPLQWAWTTTSVLRSQGDSKSYVKYGSPYKLKGSLVCSLNLFPVKSGLSPIDTEYVGILTGDADMWGPTFKRILMEDC